MDLSVGGNVFGLDESQRPTHKDMHERLDDPAIFNGVRDTGGRVSLAVDGAASNEAADMYHEAHTAWMVHRAVGGADAISAEDVVRMGTFGGAQILGLDAVGTLEVGKAADIVVMPLNEPRQWGLHDPIIAPVVSGAARPSTVLCAGKIVVENGAIPGLDLEALKADADEAVATILKARAA